MHSKISIRGLNYGIIENLNLNIYDNKITIITGKNNSGKTTLLKCIAGILNYKGEIYIDEEKALIMNKNIGLYLGNINLQDGTVFSNIIEPLNNLSIDITESKKSVYKILKKLDIENLANKNIQELSYNQKRIVAFCKSVIHSPNTILLDNPLDDIDIYYRTKIIEYLFELKNKNKITIILSTSKSDDIMLGDYIVILNNGKVVANGNRNNILKQENIFIKNGVNLPFVVELSHKLKSYKLIEKIIYDNKKLVDEIWK